MKTKIYPQDVLDQIQAIGAELACIFSLEKTNLRSISKFSNMSVNSVKSVLAGKTGNIASYALVAKALGTDLITVISKINTKVSAGLVFSHVACSGAAEQESASDLAKDAELASNVVRVSQEEAINIVDPDSQSSDGLLIQ